MCLETKCDLLRWPLTHKLFVLLKKWCINWHSYTCMINDYFFFHVSHDHLHFFFHMSHDHLFVFIWAMATFFCCCCFYFLINGSWKDKRGEGEKECEMWQGSLVLSNNATKIYTHTHTWTYTCYKYVIYLHFSFLLSFWLCASQRRDFGPLKFSFFILRPARYTCGCHPLCTYSNSSNLTNHAFAIISACLSERKWTLFTTWLVKWSKK